MTNKEKYREILARYLPEQAVDWAYSYLDRNSVRLHITRHRKSKHGDYRRPTADHPTHQISVGGDLNPYFFFWVLLHEAAHLETRLRYPMAAPHGREWQEEYARLLQECVTMFPIDVQPYIKRYASRIPFSTRIKQDVEEQLHHYDKDYDSSDHLTISQTPAGTVFHLKSYPSRTFISIEHRRTRWLCRCLENGREYTVVDNAEIIKVQTP